MAFSGMFSKERRGCFGSSLSHEVEISFSRNTEFQRLTVVLLCIDYVLQNHQWNGNDCYRKFCVLAVYVLRIQVILSIKVFPIPN